MGRVESTAEAGVGADWRALRLDPAWEATFVPLDPPRASYFALWDPSPQQGLNLAPAGGWKVREQALVGPGRQATTEHVAALTVRQAIEVFARLPANADLRPSVHAWAAVVRAALGLIARGRVLPTVSPAGWDSWRVGPLDGSQLAHIDQLAAALPPIGHAVPVDGGGVDADIPASGPLIVTADDAVASCLDAVADRLVRSPAAPRLVDSPIFAQLQPTRVPQLAAWAAEIGDRHCRSSVLDILVEPPVDPDRPPPPVLSSGFGAITDLGAGVLGEPTERNPWRLNLGLRSLRDPSLRATASMVWADRATGDAFGPRADIELTSALRDAATVCPELAVVLDEFRPTLVALDDDAFDRFLESTDELARLGVEVRWSAELDAADLDRRLVVGAEGQRGDSTVQVADLESLITVNWEFLLDGLPLTEAELETLSRSKRAMVPIRGRWVRLTSRSRRQLREPTPEFDLGMALRAIRTGAAPDPSGSQPERADDAIPVRLVGQAADLTELLDALVEGREQAEPAGLEATLRPYQRRGLAWMADLADAGLGGCLADDMGLGKTVQVLALHQHRGQRTLVICPTSLMANWAREAARFLPGVPVRRFHGPSRSLDNLGDHDLVVTTYGVVRTDYERLAAVGWDLVVADEAQHAKNPHSRTARSLRLIPGRTKLALSGTPVENRLSELWAIMDWVVPGLLGELEPFRREMALPIERDDDGEKAAALAQTVQPFLLRRHKTDPGIAPDLPPKTELDVIVPLTAEQVSLYHATVSEILALVKGLNGAERHGLVLKLLTGLKQITNHPAQYLGQDGPLAGRSGKLDALDDLVDQALLGGESMLVFSQYVAMGRLLHAHLESRGVSVALLHGSLSPSARQDLVDRFQAGDIRVLLLSLKAGGTGLNLTKATQVVHYDRWWNPAVEDQATDRAYRIGQDRPVTVHRLITEGTVEDRVAELLNHKRRLADRVVGGGESWISQLDDESLEALVSLDDSLGES